MKLFIISLFLIPLALCTCSQRNLDLCLKLNKQYEVQCQIQFAQCVDRPKKCGLIDASLPENCESSYCYYNETLKKCLTVPFTRILQSMGEHGEQIKNQGEQGEQVRNLHGNGDVGGHRGDGDKEDHRGDGDNKNDDPDNEEDEEDEEYEYDEYDEYDEEDEQIQSDEQKLTTSEESSTPNNQNTNQQTNSIPNSSKNTTNNESLSLNLSVDELLVQYNRGTISLVKYGAMLSVLLVFFE